jgi:hypothetical protein
VVNVLMVDYPGATGVQKGCPRCHGAKGVEHYSERKHMADIRGGLSPMQASHALGWPKRRWENIERGVLSMGYVSAFTLEGHEPGWPSVREALGRLRRRLRRAS